MAFASRSTPATTLQPLCFSGVATEKSLKLSLASTTAALGSSIILSENGDRINRVFLLKLEKASGDSKTSAMASTSMSLAKRFSKTFSPFSPTKDNRLGSNVNFSGIPNSTSKGLGLDVYR